MDLQIEYAEVERLNCGEHHDPHTILGLHVVHGKKVVRVWRPGAQKLSILLHHKQVEMEQVHSAGLFSLVVPSDTQPQDYLICHQSGLATQDPYTFIPSLGEIDLYLFGKGTHYELYRMLGANTIEHQGVKGVRFAVWAPSAKGVSLVADHNYWNGLTAPMRSLGSSGVWELFIPEIAVGERYKFEIRTQEGECLLKTDPFGTQFELRPKTAAIVSDTSSYEWNDSKWLEKRKQLSLARPISIYELHLGSWKKGGQGEFLNYRTLAHEISDYCIEMGFTHVELMPVAEHPFDQSWGYQVTGFYAPTSRFGTFEDFQYFIDYLHQKGIGVIVDWVPGHFPSDDFSLRKFDGTHLFEHADPKQGYHPHWNTLIFNFGRREVSNFLIANALFWIEKLHIDGLRVDAVASMLYLDYGREEGEWIANIYGGKENLEAIEFLRHFNAIVHQRCPGVMTIAEESTSFGGVSHPVEYGGLGFDMKWNMGWMNDTLRYFDRDPIYRHHHQNELTFSLLYAFSEHFSLVLSHDEVVHGKKSLLSKMPGDMWQKFANLRLLFSYQFCQPGKQLLFMGGEIGQWDEWNCDQQMQWHLLDYPLHSGLQHCVKDLNKIYQKHPALWKHDFDWQGFEWVDFSDTTNSVLIYYRKSSEQRLLCVHHFTPTFLEGYDVPLQGICDLKEIFCSDAICYGGSGKGSPSPYLHRNEEGHVVGVTLNMPPLATMIFEVH